MPDLLGRVTMPSGLSFAEGSGFEAIVVTQTNGDLCLVPNGTGALQAAITDSAIAGGNARGDNAVDWQTSRSAAIHVASGNNSVLSGGTANRSTGSAAVVGGGSSNLSSGTAASTGGGQTNTASGNFSVVPGGSQAIADHYGEHANASGRFSANGDAQRGDVGMRTAVTDATPTLLTLDGAADGASNRFTVASGATYDFDIVATAIQTGGAAGTAGDSRRFRITGSIVNKAGTTTLVAAVVATTPYGEAAAAAWTLVATANNTNDCLDLTFTGEASKSVRVNAVVRLNKTGFA